MLNQIHPKLPTRDIAITRDFYINKLGFKDISAADFAGYLIVKKDEVEIHFFEFKTIDPNENYGQVYIRTDNIKALYQFAVDNALPMPQGNTLEIKPWGQAEFSLLDPDHNLLTFGQAL